jgi:TPR repeat protein
MHYISKITIPYIFIWAVFGLTACNEPVQTAEQKFAADVKAAEQGSAEAQYKLAKMYEDGDGVAKDAVKAVEWYRKAADQGNEKAQIFLGLMYHRGEGVTKDVAMAEEWYRKAAGQGDARSQFFIGLVYDNAAKNVTKDAVMAVEWYRKAAEQGYAEAQNLLGLAYSLGEGVAKDTAKAVEWYRKAAEQSDAEAQYRLGLAYSLGEGVIEDDVVAVEWYRKSAEQGNALAQYFIGMSYETGVGVPKDAVKAVEWYRKAADQGDADAQSGLGRSYYLGKGVAKNKVLAHVWFNLAASQGDPSDVKKRDIVENELSSYELAAAQRIASTWKLGIGLDPGAAQHDAATSAAFVAGKLTKHGAGTAFWVSKSGHAITNHHVTQGCTELRIEGREGLVKLITEDKVNDLALVSIPGVVKAFAPLKEAPGKLRQGEDVVVFGFPLSAVLSSGGNLSPGVISATTGLDNNTNQIQITAPIQPGSSGSPVLNKKGEVVAVVSMKLSDTKMVRATGSVGQNVNFAVSGQTLKAFLDANKVEYKTGGFFSFEKKTADIAEEARKWTTVIECWK